MTQSSSTNGNPVHHFVLVTEGCDLLDDANFEVLYEAGCTDASIGHRTVEFDRKAPTRWHAIQHAIQDVSAASSLWVIDVRESMGTGSTEPTAPALG
ncbi:hypothetical protein [Candidatus Poriferisodalis sp.]|uniref:hypothetical protein n=1 Tax=Candidatus Poriferisodalis sp. TaxID=3101277 RepID=UPI003B529BB4